MDMMTLRTENITPVRSVRIGLTFVCHRRELGIGAPVTGQTCCHLGRLRRAFCMALVASQSRGNMFIDEKAMTGAGSQCRRRLRQRVKGNSLQQTDRNAYDR